MLSVHQQAHHAHTDIKPPDMTKYARWSELNRSTTEDASYGRQIFSYSVMGLGGMAFVTGAKCYVTSLIDMKNPSAAALAFAQTEVDIGKVAEGLLHLYCIALGCSMYLLVTECMYELCCS